MYGLQKIYTNQNIQIERLILIRFKDYQKNKTLLLLINIAIRWNGQKNLIK